MVYNQQANIYESNWGKAEFFITTQEQYEIAHKKGMNTTSNVCQALVYYERISQTPYKINSRWYQYGRQPNSIRNY